MKHIIVPADTRRFSWRAANGDIGWFEPNGRLGVWPRDAHSRALVENRASWRSTSPLYAARIFVGFNVDGQPRWKMDDAVAIVRRVRADQHIDPDSTFLYQRGLYTSKKRAGQIEDEQGTQIIVVNTFGVGYRAFKKQMLDLAEVLATELEQEEVILEIQKAGISKETIGVKGREE